MRDLVTSERIDAALAAVAAKQHGVFSLDQVLKAGGDPSIVYRRMTSGRWLRLSPRAYAFAGYSVTFHGRVLAACLTAGEWSFASHTAAADLWLPPGASKKCISGLLGACGRQASRRNLGTLDKADVTRLGSIPITRPERTLIDLASTLSREALEGTLDEFLRQELAQLPRLERHLVVFGGRAGIRHLRRLVEDRRGTAISESEFETRLLRALREEGLPTPVSQYEVRDGGHLIARVDFAYPNSKLAIEAYGRRHHSAWIDHEHDLSRQNALIAAGWRMIVVTWARLHNARAPLMRTIARALAT